MARTDVVRYLREQAKQGYRVQELRFQLQKQGYTQTEIEDAIHEAFAPKARPSLWPFLGVVAAIIILVGVYLSIREIPELESSIALQVKLSSVDVAQTIPIEITLLNTGQTPGVSINLVHELIEDKTLIAQTREILAIQKSTTKTTTLEIPEGTPAGRYTLRTTAFYNGKRELVEQQVRVVDKTVTGKPKIPYVPGVAREPTTPALTPTAPSPIIVPPSKVQQIEEIRTIALTEPERAAALCQSLDSQSKDVCFHRVATASDNKEYCKEIKKAVERDQCNLFFAFGADEEVCKEIIDERTRESCEKIITLKKQTPS